MLFHRIHSHSFLTPLTRLGETLLVNFLLLVCTVTLLLGLFSNIGDLIFALLWEEATEEAQVSEHEEAVSR